VLCGAALLLGAGRAGADEARGAEAHDVGRRSRPRVEWAAEWPRFRLWEYAGTATFGAASWYIRYRDPHQTPIKWQGTNPFDDTLRSWLRAETQEGRDLASGLSDVLSLGGYAMPFAIDLPIALFGHREPRVFWQMLMMDLEANAVSGLITNVLFYAVGRGRPSSPECARNSQADEFCNMGGSYSLPSGHVVTVATGAGLTCVHHRYLPLYGDAGADAGACVLMSLVTAVTAVSRVVADRHYASDTLLGAAIGFGAGYGLPWFLHYRDRSADGSRALEAIPSRFAVVPFGGAGGRLGLGLAGAL
jgi:membrane-associated phospholipid phosphatase